MIIMEGSARGLRAGDYIITSVSPVYYATNQRTGIRVCALVMPNISYSAHPKRTLRAEVNKWKDRAQKRLE